MSTTVPDHRPAESTPRPADGEFTPIDWSLFVAVGAIWGASFLFIDIGLDALPPGVITLMRVGLGALALAVLPRQRISVEPADRPRVVVLSIVWVAVPFTLFPIAEQHISSALAGLLNGGTPIFAAIFAVVLFRQRTRGAQLLGIAIGFVGVVLVSMPSIGDGSSEALGVAMVIAATVCYGLAVTIAAPLQQRYGSVNLMAKVLALATIFTAPYGLWQFSDASWEIGPVVAVVVLGVLGTGLAFALMGNLVGRVGSTRASFITYLIPAVALVLGVAFRGDEVFALELVGIVVIIAGALLASRRVAAALSGDQRRQDLTDLADEQPIGVAVHRRLGAVDDDHPSTTRLCPRHTVGGREHAERRADGDQQIALVAHPHRLLDHLGHQRLTEADRVALEDSTAHEAWRILLARSYPVE